MAGTLPIDSLDLSRLPTEDDLPYSDGIPMDDQFIGAQTALHHEILEAYWGGKREYFVGGNMFVYYSPERLRTLDYRGPDTFIVLDVQPRRRLRKSWVSWHEGKVPDVVFEYLSESTENFDRTEKKRIYQDDMKAPEYFWYDPDTTELVGFHLREGVYEPIIADTEGRFWSQALGLYLVRWDGVYLSMETTWLRWMTPEGVLLPTHGEMAEANAARAEQERQRAERLAAKLRELGIAPEA